MSKNAFPADWGKTPRKMIIEITEEPNGHIGFETFIVLTNGSRIAAAEASEAELLEVNLLAKVAEKLLEPVPCEGDDSDGDDNL